MRVFGDTTPLHDKQPLTAFIEITIAGHPLRSEYTNGQESRAPEYIQSLEFNKLDTSGTFTIVLFDKNWTELEETFNAGSQVVTLRYGYVTGKQSPTYEACVVDYTVRYVDSGVVLGINGLITRAVPNLNLTTLNTGTNNPTDAVKSICRANGWKIGNFDETKNVSLPNSDYFTLIKEHPISYINLRIAPYAIRKSDGMSGFRLVLDNTTSPATAHFLPLVAQEVSKKTYICRKGINSSVISFDVVAKGIFGGMGLTNTTMSAQVSTIDPLTGDVSDTEVESSYAARDDSIPTTDQKDVVSSNGVSHEMAISSAKFSTSLRTSIPYEGTLTILGDPALSIGDVIRVIIPTSKGELHVSSGSYLITAISETVSNGNYLTSLSVVRVADYNVFNPEDPVEILSYKEVAKS